MQGKTINGFELKKLLGTGGMAEVWYAENEIGMKAAVKILSEELSHNAQMKERFLNEAKVMVQLDHPNIRKVHGYGSIDGRPAIIMEYLDGSDLKARMKRGQHFTDEELRKWWNQVVDALNYTHALHIVHRDIKPSNIFIDQKGDAKLLDFGIAKVADTTSGTLTGSTLGTRIYMSPEQVKDPKRVGTASDVYSLAVSFVHLLTGKAPYDSTTSSDYDIQVSIVTKPVDMSKVPEEWRGFLTPYLIKEANKRPALRYFEVVQIAEEPETLVEKLKLLEKKPEPVKDVEDEGTVVVATKKSKSELVEKPIDKQPDVDMKERKKGKKGLWIGLGSAVVAAIVILSFLKKDPYKQIDQWLSESDRIYRTHHIEAPMEEYTLIIDSLNEGYDMIVKARQALERLSLKTPDTLVFAPRMELCDSLDRLYFYNIATIVKEELVRLSIADDTMAAVARLRQLEELGYYKYDSIGVSERNEIERDINILCNTELYPIWKGKKRGYADRSGNIVINPIFNKGENFSEGLAMVMINGKYGFINKLGMVVIDAKYDDRLVYYGFSEGLAAVSLKGKYGFINKKGDFVVDPKYEDAHRFSDGLAAVKIDDKWGFINRFGDMIIQPKYREAGLFKDGLINVGVVKNGGLYYYGFINKSGKMVVDPQYEWAIPFSEGLAAVAKHGGNFGYIDNSGKLVINSRFYSAGRFSEGLAWVRINGQYGFIDRTGQIVIEPQFEWCYGFSHGLANVQKGGKWCYIDKTGKVVFEY